MQKALEPGSGNIPLRTDLGRRHPFTGMTLAGKRREPLGRGERAAPQLGPFPLGRG